MQKLLTVISWLALASACIMAPLATNHAVAQEISGPMAEKLKLPKNSVKTKHVKDGQVQPKDMSNNSKPAIASGSEDESDTTGGVPISANTELRKVTINAPGPGVIVGTGNLNVFFPASGALYCIVNNDPTIPNPGLRLYSNSSVADFRTMSQTRAFPVAGPGIATIYLFST